jgi:hypothetical protein
VQAVALSVPSGWSTSSTTTGGSVTLTLGLPAGFSLPSNTSQTNWDTAYSMRGQWSGGATGLNAATGRVSLELGSAALASAGDFASSAQGALAATAVQPPGLASTLAAYLTTVSAASSYQPLSANLTALAANNAAYYLARSNHTGTQALSTISGLGTGIANALAVNAGATGAPVLFDGAGGTPSSLGLVNATGLPLATGVSGLLSIANGGTGTATPGLVAGTHVNITGTWPNQTISVTGGHGGPDGGTVTSVGLSLPALFSVTGSPVTTAGTLTATLAAQGANLVWAGPATGMAAAPTFRSLVASDIPTISAGQVSGLATVATSGGTGDLTETGGNQFFAAARAIGSALTGFVAEAGTVAATDSILQAINKIVGNIAGRALAGAIGSSGLTMTAGVLGRESGTGAPQVYPLGSGLSIVAGALTVTATDSGSDYLAILASSEVAVTTTATATISRQHLISGTTADYTVTLPAAAGNAGKFISFRISDAATRRFTISGNASELINGQNRRIMWAGESAVLYCDGSGWLKLSGVTKPMQCQISLTSNQTISNLTMTDVTFSRVDVDNTGAMADTANSRIINFRPGQYILMAHLMWDNTTGSATRLIGQIFNSNTSVAITAHEMTAFAASCYPSCQPYALVALLATSRIKLQAYKSANVTNVYGHPTTDTTQLMAIEVPSW